MSADHSEHRWGTPVWERDVIGHRVEVFLGHNARRSGFVTITLDHHALHLGLRGPLLAGGTHSPWGFWVWRLGRVAMLIVDNGTDA